MSFSLLTREILVLSLVSLHDICERGMDTYQVISFRLWGWAFSRWLQYFISPLTLTFFPSNHSLHRKFQVNLFTLFCRVTCTTLSQSKVSFLNNYLSKISQNISLRPIAPKNVLFYCSCESSSIETLSELFRTLITLF